MPNENTGEVSFEPSQFKPLPVQTGTVEIPFDPSDFKPIAAAKPVVEAKPAAEVSFDPADFKPIQSAPSSAPSPAQPSIWDRVTRVLTESPLAKSLGEFFDPNANRAAWEAAGPELRKRPEFALRHAPMNSPEAWRAIFSLGGVKALPSVANEADNRSFGVGSDSPISPAAAMTPTEQREHPIATAAGDVAGGMASGGNIATLAATSGFGVLGKAGTTLSRLVSGGFSLSQLWDAAKTSPEVLQAIKDGDVPRAQYLLTKMGLTVGLAQLGAKHATGKGADAGKTEAQPSTETHPLPTDEPVAQILQEQVPDVRITESAAGKNHLVAQDTVAEPKARTGWTDITPQAVNPQEVADTSRALGRPVTEAELPEIRRRLAAEENVKAGLAGNRRDTAGEIREAHRATLESKPGEPIRVFHGSTANVADVSQLDPVFSRDGSAGRGIYLSESPSDASRYAGPPEPSTGGRVLGGLLDAKARLIQGSEVLPEPIRAALTNEFPDLDTSKPYLQVLLNARRGDAGVETTPDGVQEVVSQFADGVRYERQYADGAVHKGIMLFANDPEL